MSYDHERTNTNQYRLYNLSEEHQQRREFDLLLEGWLEANRTRPTVSHEHVRFDVETIVADARAALERSSTPYIALLLIIAPQFLSLEDRELELLEVEDA